MSKPDSSRPRYWHRQQRAMRSTRHLRTKKGTQHPLRQQQGILGSTAETRRDVPTTGCPQSSHSGAPSRHTPRRAWETVITVNTVHAAHPLPSRTSHRTEKQHATCEVAQIANLPADSRRLEASQPSNRKATRVSTPDCASSELTRCTHQRPGFWGTP